MEAKYHSVFDIPIKDQYDNPNILEQYRGKVLVFINTTGHCGNVPQWPIIDEISKEYTNKNIQIIYVPTNDFCGSVTYGEYKNGITHAKESSKFAKKTYNIDGVFTELVSSRRTPWPNKYDRQKEDFSWEFNEEAIKKREEEGQTPISDLYDFLTPQWEEPLHGNFTKFIINKKGIPVARFADGTFLNIEHSIKEGFILSPEEEINNFKSILDEVLLTDKCTNSRYSYNPYREKELQTN